MVEFQANEEVVMNWTPFVPVRTKPVPDATGEGKSLAWRVETGLVADIPDDVEPSQ